MKAEERHKLKANQLLEFLQRLPEMLRKHSRALVGGGVVVVLVILVLVVVYVRRAGVVSAGWNRLNVAINKMNVAIYRQRTNDLTNAAEEFDGIAADYSNTSPITAWARYYQGHVLLTQANRRMLGVSTGVNRDLLSKAEDAFNEALKQPYHPLISPLAKIELADAFEDEGRFDDARKLYDEVANDHRADYGPQQQATRMRDEMPTHPTRIVFARAAAPTTSRDWELSPLRGGMMDNLQEPIPAKPPVPIVPEGVSSGEPGSRPTPQSQPASKP